MFFLIDIDIRDVIICSWNFYFLPQRIREFYKYLAQEYPYLAFTFHGRIKSLIRAEEKFNGYISGFIYEYYQEHGKFPHLSAIKDQVNRFRDLIAYRIVISMSKCHLKPGDDPEKVELHLLYGIANRLPDFLEELVANHKAYEAA